MWPAKPPGDYNHDYDDDDCDYYYDANDYDVYCDDYYDVNYYDDYDKGGKMQIQKQNHW